MKYALGTIGALIVIVPACAALAAPHSGGGSMHGAGPNSASPASTTATPSTLHGPTQTGQPNQSCQSVGVYPGHASSSPGSPFNEPSANSAGGNAGSHYAGSQPQNSRNTASVSQYDVACANQVK